MTSIITIQIPNQDVTLLGVEPLHPELEQGPGEGKGLAARIDLDAGGKTISLFLDTKDFDTLRKRLQEISQKRVTLVGV